MCLKSACLKSPQKALLIAFAVSCNMVTKLCDRGLETEHFHELSGVKPKKYVIPDGAMCTLYKQVPNACSIIDNSTVSIGVIPKYNLNLWRRNMNILTISHNFVVLREILRKFFLLEPKIKGSSSNRVQSQSPFHSDCNSVAVLGNHHEH